jgi:peptidoglycan/xylan/chitin deacetylase (PgdA/CDA1 family)
MRIPRSVLLGLALIVVCPSAASAARTVVTLGFDDGLASQVSARAMLAAHGMHATFFLNSGKIGHGTAMSWSQVAGLAADGNEVAGHTVDHPLLTSLSTAAQKTEICKDRTTLSSHGYTATDFAYPFGRYTTTTQALAKSCGYASARTTTTPDLFSESIPPGDPYATRAFEVFATDSLATIESYVAEAEQNGGGWVQLVMHDVCDGCDPTYAISPATLGALLDWLAPRASRGTIVRTTRDVITGNLPPPPPPPPPAPNLLTNPSLELAAGGVVPDCWELAGWGTNTASALRTPDAHSGGFAEQVGLSAVTDGDQKLIVKRDGGPCAPAVTAGDSYNLSAWYRASAAAFFVVYLRDPTGSWRRWWTSPYLPVSPAWAQASWTTPPLPSDATAASIGLAIDAPGTLTTDDYYFGDAADA